MLVINRTPPHYNEYLKYIHKLAKRGLVSSVTYEDYLKINYNNNEHKQ